nr:Chain A, SSTNVG from Islet Amyloid Polypeptide [unidentified]3FTR_A Chain A, SSTNVG FROM ISLET AMYLOID POLYPEPTIDE [unidentified]
SSTNVG